MATFIIVVVILGQKSGERLKDHWFSGFYLLLGFQYSLFSFCSSGVINEKISWTERLTLVTNVSTTWGGGGGNWGQESPDPTAVQPEEPVHMFKILCSKVST